MLGVFQRSGVFLLAIVVAIGAGAFAIKSYRQTKVLNAQIEALKQEAPETSEAEVQQLVEEVGKLIALPEGEQPTIATISDKEKLKDVPFFLRSENDDKVLIYVNARKAFLYRPSTQKLIEVATLNLNTAASNQGFAPKIALRNATTVAGFTTTFESQLKQLLPAAEVVTKDNAKETGRTETLVVDLSGTQAAEARRLATALGAKVGALPAGETKPAGADFLVLLGSDKTTSSTPTARAIASPTTTTTPTPESENE